MKEHNREYSPKSKTESPLPLSRLQIEALPKVELHVHLDCCLSFDALSQLKPGITREQYRNDFVGPSKCKDLADFLKVIDSSLTLLQTTEGLQVAVDDLFRQFQQDSVIYAEIRFAPLLHLAQGLGPERVVEIVETEVSRCVQETGIDAGLILCTLRHFTPEQSLTTAKLVEQFKNTHVVALDLAADEAGFSLDAHIPSFNYVKERNLFRTAHAGEARGPESVWETLEHLKPTRIGHGVRSIHDPALIEVLKEKQIHLEVCPTCNVQIDVFDTYANHPVDRLYRAGVSVGINTDTRTITGVSLSDEYERLHEVFGWGKEHFLTCNRNALNAAFLPNESRKELETQLSMRYTNETH